MSIGLPTLPGLGDATNPVVAPTAAVSPAALQAQRDYAKALMYGTQGKGGAQFPVVQSWTQGVSNMVNALLGGGEMYNANQREATQQNRMASSTDTTPAKTSFSEGPSSEGQETSGGDLSKEAKAIASVESAGSGDYSAVGPKTRTGDRAYGKYQVMGANVPNWTKEVLGKELTPDEFLNSPEAQDAVFKVKFAQGGDNNNDRASTWFTGKPYAQGASRSDGNINGAQYVDRFNKALGTPSAGGPAMAFSGPDSSNGNPAVQAVSAALRGDPAGGTQVAASRGAAPGARPPMPSPNGSGIYIDPGLVQKRPQMSQSQIRDIMSNPGISETAKLGFLQQYQQQSQPVDVPYPGGVVRVNPNDPRQQQFIPEGHWGTSEVGDIKGQKLYIPDGKGGVTQAPVNTPPPAAVGPRSDAAPAPVAEPTAAPQGGPMPVAAGGPATAETAPVAPAAPPVAPVQVASNDPTAAFAAGAPKPAEPVVPVAAVPDVKQTPAQAASPLNKMAQAAPPPGVSQQDWDAYTQKKGFDNATALAQKSGEAKIDIDKDSQMKAADAAAKKYDTLSTQAQAARKQMPNLDLGLAMMNDPRFHSGLLSGAQDTWARFKEAIGGDRLANAPNEAFDKIMAGTILDNMRTALGGLGQVRLAEISLLTKANANRNNTDASNRAVLEVSRRAVQSVDHLDQLGQAYASGDEVIDPISGKTLMKANVGKDGEITPRHGLDVGYDKLARKYTLEHPSFTPEEIKRYESIFETGRDPNAAPAATPAAVPGAVAPAGGQTFQPAPPAAIEILKANPGSRELFEKRYGPADKYLNAK